MMKLRHCLLITSIALSPVTASASTMVLSDILSVDALGYECIAGEYFEENEDQAAIAFTLSEKIRLPRTCLPNPCDGALSRRELSRMTGTEATLARFEEEWDEYYARYADHCRKEIVDPSKGEVADQEFWEPFRPQTTPPVSVATFTPTPGPNPPTFPPLVVSPNPPEVTPVPLPSSALLMLSGLFLFWRRKST